MVKRFLESDGTETSDPNINNFSGGDLDSELPSEDVDNPDTLSSMGVDMFGNPLIRDRQEEMASYSRIEGGDEQRDDEEGEGEEM